MEATEVLLKKSTEHEEIVTEITEEKPNKSTDLCRYSDQTKCVVMLLCIKTLVCNGCTTGIGIFLFVTEKRQEIKETNVSVSRVILYLALSLIIVVALVTLCSCLACIATIRENQRILIWYAQVLKLTVIFHFVIAFIGCIFVGKANGQIQEIISWNTFIEHYLTDFDIRVTIDKIQKKLECCGFNDYNDWEANEVYSCASLDPRYACSVPTSCCKRESHDCAVHVRKPLVNATKRAEVIKTTGCLRIVQDWYRYNFILLSSTSVFLAFSQLLANWATQKYIYVISLKNSVKNSYSTITNEKLKKYLKLTGLMNLQKTKTKPQKAVAEWRQVFTDLQMLWARIVSRFLLLKQLGLRLQIKTIKTTRKT